MATALFQSGNLGDRAEPGTRGKFFLATDTADVSIDNGVGWESVGAFGEAVVADREIFVPGTGLAGTTITGIEWPGFANYTVHRLKVWANTAPSGASSTNHIKVELTDGTSTVSIALDSDVQSFDANLRTDTPLMSGPLTLNVVGVGTPPGSAGDDLNVWIQVGDLVPFESAYEAEVLADSPVAYWRLDETSGTAAADSSGNGHDGTYSGSPTLGVAGLASGSTGAVDFDGTNDYISIPDHADWDLTALTLEMWASTDAASGSGSGAFLIQHGGASYNWGIYENSGDRQWDLYVRLGASVYTLGIPSVDITTGQTHHVAATYDGSTLRIFLDGVEKPSLSQAGTLSTNAGPIEIARWSPNYFGGLIDEVAVYDTALSPARILAHYTAGAPTSYPAEVMADSPLRYLRLNEGAETYAQDSSVNDVQGQYLGTSYAYASAFPDSGGAHEFKGSPDALYVDDLSANSPTSFELWFELGAPLDSTTTVAGGAGTLMTMSTAVDANAYVYIGSLTGTFTDEVISVLNDSSTIKGAYWADASATIAAGWHHLVVQWNGTAWEIHLDGDSKPTTEHGTQYNPAWDAVHAARYFVGAIDEVAIYETNLTPARIQAHYDAGFVPPVGTMFSYTSGSERGAGVLFGERFYPNTGASAWVNELEFVFEKFSATSADLEFAILDASHNVLTSKTVSAVPLTATLTWQACLFDDDVYLTEDVKYWVAVRSATGVNFMASHRGTGGNGVNWYKPAPNHFWRGGTATPQWTELTDTDEGGTLRFRLNYVAR